MVPGIPIRKIVYTHHVQKSVEIAECLYYVMEWEDMTPVKLQVP